MSENNPTPPGGAPEASKVQPKKETVRINLPPKPTASPTIKIPAPSTVATATPAPAAPIAAPATAAPPAPTAAHATAQRPAPAAAPRQAPARSGGGGSRTSGVDVGLAVVAALVAVAVVVRIFMLSSAS